MTIKERIEAAKVKQAELRKLTLELKMKDEALAVELQTLFRDIGLGDNFSPVDIMDKAINYSPIIGLADA